MKKGEGGSKDVVAASKLYERSCPRVAAACTALANLYYEGTVLTEDLARAFALYTTGCTGEEPTACYMIGRMYADGSSVEADPARAASYYRKACKLGSAEGCAAAK
jgi:TPR repeat protein